MLARVGQEMGGWGCLLLCVRHLVCPNEMFSSSIHAKTEHMMFLSSFLFFRC